MQHNHNATSTDVLIELRVHEVSCFSLMHSSPCYLDSLSKISHVMRFYYLAVVGTILVNNKLQTRSFCGNTK